MAYNDQTIFTLGNSLAAISAARRNGSIAATDGQSCFIHLFDGGGNFSRRIDTVRAYRRLRLIENGFAALACCDSADIYILDCDFNEKSRITLDAPCDCRRSGINGLIDADAVTQCGRLRFIGGFSEGAYMFEQNGERAEKLCRADSREAITDFISAGNGCYALATVCGNTQTVSISTEKETVSAVLSRKYVLRTLFYESGTVYGLFGRNYIYNHIIPIYSDGVLTLPK